MALKQNSLLDFTADQNSDLYPGFFSLCLTLLNKYAKCKF